MSTDLAGRRSHTDKVTHIPGLRLVEVVKKSQINTRLIRLTVAGASLTAFRSDGFDDHVKVFFPSLGHPFTKLPSMGAQGPVFADDAAKPVMRDYTPHQYDTQKLTLQLDFVLHPGGVGSGWARSAEADEDTRLQLLTVQKIRRPLDLLPRWRGDRFTRSFAHEYLRLEWPSCGLSPLPQLWLRRPLAAAGQDAR
jgi:NADPH-dependent ferric siderophore reductase